MKTKLANLIKTKRKELKLSQKTLAEGICTQTIISRIEKGEITPSVDIFFKIIKKLCIPMEDVANLFSLDMTNVKDLSFDFYELEEILVKRDYKTLSVLVKSINLESLNKEEVLHVEWLKSILLYQVECKLDVAIKKLESLSEKVEIGSLLFCKICNTLGNLYSEREDFLSSKKYYELVLPYLDVIKGTSFEQPFYYSISRIYGMMKQLDEATKWNALAISKSLNAKSFYMLGDNYFLQSKLFEEQKLVDSAIDSCNKAITIFMLESNEYMKGMALSYLSKLKEKENEEIL